MTDHYQTDAQIARIRQLLLEGLSRAKIMEQENLTDRQMRYATEKIHEQDRELWKDQANESLESRALKIKNKYQELADVCQAIVRDEKKSPRDRIEAGKTGIACENNIYNMLKDGPLKLNTIQAKQLEDKT